MDNTLLRSEPAELAVGDKASPKGRHVGGDVLEVAPDHVMGEQVDSGDAQLGPPPDCEREAVPRQAVGMVGLEDDIGRGIVGVCVHRIRPVEGSRGRKADVARDGPQDPCTHLGSELYAKAPMFVSPTSWQDVPDAAQSTANDRLATIASCATQPERDL